MDLRKSVLKKQQNILCESLNYSNASAYESALEDSVYYSFNETRLDDSNSEKDEDAQNISACSEVDKENTIIMRAQSPQIGEKTLVENNEEAQSMEELRSQAAKTSINEQEIDQVGKVTVAVFVNPKELETQPAKETEISDSSEQNAEAAAVTSSIPDIIITKPDDFPNLKIENIVEDRSVVNPFTAPVGEVPDSLFEIPKQSTGAIRKKSLIPVEKKVTRRSIVISKLPSLRVYSPVIRKSLDRKSKAVSKLVTKGRSIYNAAKQGERRRSGSKAPNKPKEADKIQKCTVAGCTEEFTTSRAYLEHQKTHKGASSSICQYCDKNFQLAAAFFSHQTEKCTKIPFNEKRKLLAKRDKNEPDRRRTAMFLAPVPKAKSPTRKKPANETLNKSGIKITPKKSLKCHRCAMIFLSAVTLAEHIVTVHKLDKGKPTD